MIQMSVCLSQKIGPLRPKIARVRTQKDPNLLDQCQRDDRRFRLVWSVPFKKTGANQKWLISSKNNSGKELQKSRPISHTRRIRANVPN